MLMLLFYRMLAKRRMLINKLNAVLVRLFINVYINETVIKKIITAVMLILFLYFRQAVMPM